MRVQCRGRRAAQELPGIRGVARLDRSTAALTERLRPGEVAVLDHLDLDRASAERLLERGVAAVINVAPSLSGRHPARGAALLLERGVPLLDDVGGGVFALLREGQRVRLDLDAGELLVDDTSVATGTVQTAAALQAAQTLSRGRLAGCLNILVADAADLLVREPELVLEGLPQLPGALSRQRPVLVVTADPRAAGDLAALRSWIRRAAPVVLVVEEGARAAADAGLAVDVLVGGLAAVPEADLRAVGEVVALGDEAAARAEGAGVGHLAVSTGLPALAVALATVAASTAPVVVAAGMPDGLEDLMDGGRGEAAATLLTRLRLEGRIVDARALALAAPGHRGRASGTVGALLVVVAALLAALAVLAVSAPGQVLLERIAPGLTLR